MPVATPHFTAAPTWSLEKLGKAPRILPTPATFSRSEAAQQLPEGVRALSFKGLPCKGKPTRVFAFYGVPENATAANPVPGIVLVHGGGGTAFAGWVKRWLDHGYAAIAFDHNGGIPVGAHSAWERNPVGAGPSQCGVGDIHEPIADQWMYHAVADTVLAHSLLASLPGVDATRIGVTGVSWGAVVAANVAGLDSRLKFAALVYGCGTLGEDDSDGSRYLCADSAWDTVAEPLTAWSRLWDPKNRLPRARLPILWLNGTNDFAFTPCAWRRSHRLSPGPRALSMRVRMKHGHGLVGEGPAEIPAFADSIVNGGAPLTRILTQDEHDGTAWITFETTVPIVRAEFNFTRDDGRWQDRVWKTSPATIDRGLATIPLPLDVTAYYFNLIDERGLTISGEHQEPQ